MNLRRSLLPGVGLVLLLATAVVGAGDPPPTQQQPEGLHAFHARCGFCHLERGTGTIMLGWRLGADKALLENRTDLDATYVRAIVRAGLRSMPALTRVEVTDGELDTIARYLAGPKPAGAGSR
jgi:mono/diheme cytochrome c family protein